MRRKTNKSLPYLSVAAAMLLIIAYGTTIAPVTFIEPITRICIFILFAMSTNILMGYIGIMPMGQPIFVGISAYTYTICMSKYGMSIGVSILIALALSLALSVVIGYFCLRRGEGFAVGFLYLGFNTLLQMICLKSIYLGCEGGVNGAKRFEMFSSNQGFLVFVVIVVGLLYMLIYRMMHSPAAKVMQGIRENSERVTFLGVDIFRFKLLTFCISAMLTAIGGILFAMFLRGAYPNMFNNNVGMQWIMMCMIGGMMYFYGPTIGAVIGTLLFSQLSNVTMYWQGVIGIILVICVLFFRDGFLGFCVNRRKARQSDRQSGGTAEPNGR